jgi:putative tricarboxylic transport membrane protein
MTLNGRAEAALAISAIASFIGGMIANIALVFIALPVARFSLKFGPAEYCLLMVFALAATAAMSKDKMLLGFIGMFFGLMIATVGQDALTGISRFTFGILELQGGIDFLIIIIGIYALGEVFKSFKTVHDPNKKMQTKFGKIWITKEDWKRSWPAILRSTPLGFFIGALPGAGGTMAALMSYNNEKNLSKHPDEFGKGAIEGLAAPEAANNASSVGALIPMMTLGIPGSGTTAVMLGALLMLGLQPGPLLFEQQPDVAWGMIASMFIGNIVLVIVNLPLASALVRVLAIPGKILYPIILGLSFIGTYAITNSTIDFFVLIMFGLIGIYMEKAKIPSSPMILAGIVGGYHGVLLPPGSPDLQQRYEDLCSFPDRDRPDRPDGHLHRGALRQGAVREEDPEGGVSRCGPEPSRKKLRASGGSPSGRCCGKYPRPPSRGSWTATVPVPTTTWIS